MKYLYKLIKVVYSTLTLLSNFLKYTLNGIFQYLVKLYLQLRARSLSFEIKLLFLFFLMPQKIR